jgi:Zn-dependent peptidase ImmA (M78 family)
MAEVAGCTVHDIAVLCKSNSGATHYDLKTNRYLILYNADMNSGRVRWTLAHEIGHICLGHLEAIGEAKIAYVESRWFYDQFESEADYFTWNLLAPLPIMREMDIRSILEIKQTYGLSSQAAALQYDRYTKWCRSHVKTACENEMLRLFRSKYIN